VLSTIIIWFMLAVWLFLAIAQFCSARKENRWRRLLLFVAPFFLAVGAIGFFGSALSSTGGLSWLPTSFEWPVGHAKGVVTTADHFFVVPHTPSGRIQIYNRDWKFLRGWHVDGGGGNFRLYITNGSQINVITSRGSWHYVFDLQGALLSKEHYPQATYDSFPVEGAAYTVPTAPWLWVFTSPAYSWLAAAVGMLLLFLKDKLTRPTYPQQDSAPHESA
jgi:hypothetical protein